MTIRVNGVPLAEFLQNQTQNLNQDQETKEAFDEATHVPRYKKPYSKGKVCSKQNTRPGPAKTLSRKEIMDEFGINTANLTMTEKILWALKTSSSSSQPLTLSQITQALTLPKTSASSRLSYIVRRRPHLVKRSKNEQGKYQYYLDDEYSSLSFSGLVDAYNDATLSPSQKQTSTIDININFNINFTW